MAALIPWIPLATEVLTRLLNDGSKSGRDPDSDRDRNQDRDRDQDRNRDQDRDRDRDRNQDRDKKRDREREREREQYKEQKLVNKTLKEELRKYREQNKELLSRFDNLTKELEKKKIETFEQLAEQDKEARNTLIQLAQETKPAQMDGFNIGLFGSTSTGKSTMLNSLLGEKKAATGAGETTLEVTAYPGKGYTLWDVPGRNDEISYLSMKYISFFKGLSKRMILIQATVKENSSLMKLLDEIGVNYDIIFNKFDMIDDEEQEKVKQQIQSEVQKLGLKRKNKTYFISAKKPNMFPDWLTLVDDLTK